MEQHNAQRPAAGRPRLKCPTVMRCVRMFGSDTVNKGFCLFRTLHASYRNDETATANHLFFTMNFSGRKIRNVVTGNER